MDKIGICLECYRVCAADSRGIIAKHYHDGMLCLGSGEEANVFGDNNDNTREAFKHHAARWEAESKRTQSGGMA